MTQLEQQMSVSEAAKRLGVSRMTVHRWIRQDRLPGVHAGGVTLLARSDVEVLASGRERWGLASLIDDVVARRRKGWRLAATPQNNDRATIDFFGPGGEHLRVDAVVVERTGI